MPRELTKAELAERSINKKFRKEIWNNFIAAVKNYRLIEENDRIAVCISGGKDSMMLAVLMRMLQRYSDVHFDLEYLVMNPGYNEKNLKKSKKTPRRWSFLFMFLTPTFSALPTVLQALPAIFAPE